MRRTKYIDHNKIIWPTEKPVEIPNFLDTGLDLLKEEFGALSQDAKNPLSRVCVANSSFSLEPVRGCPMGCSYCIVGGDLRNLGLENNKVSTKETRNFKSLYPRKPEVIFPGEVLSKALIKHPAFIKNDSVISIATGSSEAFIPISEAETWAAMKYFSDKGLKNPFWIVTKRGIPDNLLSVWLKRFTFLRKKGIKIIISITYSNAPSWVEPYQHDRFRNFDKIKNVGVYVSQHIRPIIRGINDDKKSLEKALENSYGLVESVCVGGLRKDPSVMLAWKFAKGLDPNLLPDIQTGDRNKDLTEGTIELVEEIIREKRYKIPVFSKSSHVISQALKISDYNLYSYRPDDKRVFLKIPLHLQKEIVLKYKKCFVDVLTGIAIKIGLKNTTFIIRGEKVIINNKLNYPEHRAFIHAIGHSRILP